MDLVRIEKHKARSIFLYSIPAIIAMVLSSLVTIIDGVFISKFIGKEALASLNLGLPIVYVFLAIGIMIGVGGSSIAGISLGRKDIDTGLNIFNQTIVTGLLALLSVSILLNLGFDYILSLTKLSMDIKFNIKAYYSVMLWVYPFININIIFGMFIRGEGKPIIFMVSNIIITLLNIILDYYFIVILNQGFVGIAIASAISVVCGTIFMLFVFINPKTIFSFKRFKFSVVDFRMTLFNGSSELIGQLAFSITIFFMNLVVLDKLGIIGIAAMTIIGYSRYIFDMIVIGFGQGMCPITSYGFGAKEYELIDKIRVCTCLIVFVMGVVVYLSINLLSSMYAGFFTRDKDLVELVINALSVFAIGFTLSGFNEITSFYFTSIGNAKSSIIISSLRGLILLSINIFLLTWLFGASAIWIIYPITELECMVVSMYQLKRYNRIA